jgi:hypothetical protein
MWVDGSINCVEHFLRDYGRRYLDESSYKAVETYMDTHSQELRFN